MKKRETRSADVPFLRTIKRQHRKEIFLKIYEEQQNGRYKRSPILDNAPLLTPAKARFYKALIEELKATEQLFPLSPPPL